MNQENGLRLAIGLDLGLVVAVEITKSGFNPQESILGWLIIALATTTTRAENGKFDQEAVSQSLFSSASW
jgi:hypothetical protein